MMRTLHACLLGMMLFGLSGCGVDSSVEMPKEERGPLGDPIKIGGDKGAGQETGKKLDLNP